MRCPALEPLPFRGVFKQAEKNPPEAFDGLTAGFAIGLGETRHQPLRKPRFQSGARFGQAEQPLPAVARPDPLLNQVGPYQWVERTGQALFGKGELACQCRDGDVRAKADPLQDTEMGPVEIHFGQ